ncbi:MAG: hypothetical protein JW955_05125 [Sedimentisphaerales bacterium]|nr:hypothetical protein [Sedimentisphaerales bacterium]
MGGAAYASRRRGARFLRAGAVALLFWFLVAAATAIVERIVFTEAVGLRQALIGPIVYACVAVLQVWGIPLVAGMAFLCAVLVRGGWAGYWSSLGILVLQALLVFGAKCYTMWSGMNDGLALVVVLLAVAFAYIAAACGVVCLRRITSVARPETN